MIAFQIDDMTCGHCVSTLTRALEAADPQAQVSFDLARHRVQIEPARADAQALRQAITDAGYTPVPVQPAPPGPATPRAGQGGCCGCGT